MLTVASLVYSGFWVISRETEGWWAAEYQLSVGLSETAKWKSPVRLSFLFIGFWNREIISSVIHILSLSQQDNTKIEYLQQTPQFGNDNVSEKQIELTANGENSFSKQIANCLPPCMEGKKSLRVKATSHLEQGTGHIRRSTPTEAQMPLIQSCVYRNFMKTVILAYLPTDSF